MKKSKKTEETIELPILEHVRLPEDYAKIPQSQMPVLAEEIRQFLIDSVTQTGGHLASNLGAVELTMAIHTVFSLPEDHLIFDVGHQSYVHKILSGRLPEFSTLRQPGGISGFTKRDESPYDCFGAGHSSTSLSAALGFADADFLQQNNHYTIAVVGDGAFTGGMIHEALNNLKPGRRLVLIINENEMSISKNIGRFAANLSRLRTRASYYRAKRVTGKTIKRIPLIGKPIFVALRATKQAFKNLLYGSNYFEDMGLYYLGPVDGHSYENLVAVLREARDYNGISIVHVKTKKGKGYEPAELQPDLFHGIRSSHDQKPTQPTFSNVMGEKLCRIAKEDTRICAITAAMCEGTGLVRFRSELPDRYFDVGIAEEHAVTYAAGLAAAGQRPVFAVYSTFLQRSYDQLIHDVALQHLGLVLCIDRAGLSESDGPTHHGIMDVSMLLQLPHTTIYAPISNQSLVRMMDKALSDMNQERIVAIRYPNAAEDASIISHFQLVEPTSELVHMDTFATSQPDALIVTYGKIVKEAMKAQTQLEAMGRRVGIMLIEELSAELVLAKLPDQVPVVLLEEGIESGGFAQHLSDGLGKRTHSILAIQNPFVSTTKTHSAKEEAGLGADSICEAVQLLLN